MLIDMSEQTKEKIYMALAVLGFVTGCVMFFELLKWFMWACFEAGIPM